MLGPSKRTWVGVGAKLLVALYPGGTKILGPLDGLWVGLAIEVLRPAYPSGSDVIYLGRSCVPIGDWFSIVILEETCVTCGTMVELVSWRGRIV